MISVTIREARVRLNRLIEQARQGEDVVLLRGSRHVACLVPIDASDLELRPRLTDAQAARLWQDAARERESGRSRAFASPADAVAHLRRAARKRTRK